MYLYGRKFKTIAIKKIPVEQTTSKFQRADSRISSMKNSFISSLKRQTIQRERKKRGVTTLLIII